MNLHEKLKQLANRHEELSSLLGAEDATQDMDRFTKLNKEYADLTPVVEAFNAYDKMLNDKAGAEEMLADTDADAEMKELAKMELDELHEAIPAAEEKLKVLLLPTYS